MKKLFCLFVALILLVGCDLVTTKYKEGIFEGTAVDTYGGQENTASAKITVDKDGKITAVYLDTTYTTKDGTKSTKKALGNAYGMKKGNSNYGKSDLEWFEQIENLEKIIIEKQEIEFLKLDEEGITDTVSGCTIKIDALYKALESALKNAKA